jgi:hypothetical protein
MRAHRLQCGLIVATGLLLSSCENGSIRPESTPAEIADESAITSGATGAQVFHFKSRGPLAQVSFFAEGPAGVMIGFVEVMRGGSTTDQQTFLFYTIDRCDPVAGECVPVEQGSGLIPNRDLKVQGRQTTLHTNTSVEANPAFDRINGSGGAITLQWTRTSAIVSEFRGHSRTRIRGVLLEHSQFASTFSSAITKGTVIAAAVSPGNSGGTVGTVRSGTVFIAKAP